MRVTYIFYSVLAEDKKTNGAYRSESFEAKQNQQNATKEENSIKSAQNEKKEAKSSEKFYFFAQNDTKTEKKLEKIEEDPLFGVIKGDGWFELFYKNGTTKHIRHSSAENLEYYLKRLNRLYDRTEIPFKIEILK